MVFASVLSLAETVALPRQGLAAGLVGSGESTSIGHTYLALQIGGVRLNLDAMIEEIFKEGRGRSVR